MAGFAVIAWATGNVNFAAYLHIPYIPYTSELVVVCTAIAANCSMVQHLPSTSIQGRCWPLALGGALGVIAVLVRQELVLVIMAVKFVMETLSVILAGLALTNCVVSVFSAWHRFTTTMNLLLARTACNRAFLIISMVLVLAGLATLKVR